MAEFQRSSSRNLARCALRWTSALCAVGLAISLVACDQQDRAESAIQDATRTLTALMPGSTPIIAPTEASRKLNEIVRNLGNLPGARPGQQAAAQILVARSHMGLGLIAEAEVAALEPQRAEAMASLSALLTRWTSLKSHESALRAFDPRSETAALDQQIAELNRQVVEERAARQAVEDQVATLRRQSSEAMNKARAERAKQIQVEQRVASVSAVEGAELMRRSMEHRRAADAHEAAAADHDALAATIAPEIYAKQLMIDRLLGQVTLIEKAKEQVNARTRVYQERAAIAATEADAVAKELDRVATGLRALYSGSMSAKTEEAVRAFQSASSAADRAMSASREQASAAKGEALHALGGFLTAQGDRAAGLASLFSAIASASPALSDAARYGQEAEDYRQSAAASHRQAAEALQGAIEAFQSARFSGEAAETIDAVITKIERSLERLAPGSRASPEQREPLDPTDGQD